MSKPTVPLDVFEENGINVRHLGDAMAQSLASAIGRPVSVLFFIDDETGQVASASNLAPEQIGEFLDFIRAQHRAGGYRVEKEVMQ